MKTNELKEKLVQNGVESEKKAKSIITWHEAFAFLSVVVIFNMLSALFNINWGLITLIVAIISIFLSKRYIEKNLDNIEKINKTYKVSKIFSMIILITIVVLILGVIIWGIINYTMKYKDDNLGIYKENNYSDNLGIYKDADVDGVKIVLSSDNMDKDTIEDVKRVLGQRIEEFFSEQYEIKVEKSRDNKHNIIIKIPNQKEVDELSKLLIKEGKIKFVEPTTTVDEEGNLMITIDHTKVVMEGDDIVSAKALYGNTTGDLAKESSYFIKLEISSEATKKFAEATERLVNQPIGIMLDESVISAPMVSGRIDTSAPIITGDFTQEEASELSKMINIGCLPVKLEIETAEYLENINGK